MKLALGLFPMTMDELAAHAVRAERSGFDALWVGDIQSTHPELYVSLTTIARACTTASVGPGVTNAVTRDPAVTASAMAALSDASGGRAFLGIGTGDSALHNIGLQPARMADLREYIATVRALWTEGQAQYRGRTLRLTWWNDRSRIPVYVAAHGPKMLELAAQVADGVIIGTGITPDAIRYANDSIDRAAVAAGRDPRVIERWFFCMANVDESDEAAVESLATPLSALANLLIRGGTEGKAIPPEYLAAFQELETRYDFSSHAEASTTGSNASLVREVGLLSYLAERFAVAGTGETVRRRLGRLEEAGVDSLWFTRTTNDTERFLDAWSTSVRG